MFIARNTFLILASTAFILSAHFYFYEAESSKQQLANTPVFSIELNSTEAISKQVAVAEEQGSITLSSDDFLFLGKACRVCSITLVFCVFVESISVILKKRLD